MDEDQFDLAGFCVGVVQEDRTLGRHRVRQGDVLVGLASSGLHANGYSLVRRVLLDPGTMTLDEAPPGLGGRTLAEELLEPTAIYAPLVADLAGDGLLSAAAHVTGGGIGGNLARVLPEDMGAELDPAQWIVPRVFDLIARGGDISRHEMFEVFNMGVGMILVCPEQSVDAVLTRARDAGAGARIVGRVAPPGGVRIGGISPIGGG
jgi:phosphoribosylformylglycinamidine cyclo-ligase